MKGVDGFHNHRRQVGLLARHGQCTGGDAGDIDEVADQTLHPDAAADDAARVRGRLVPGWHLFDQRRKTQDDSEHVTQVVADDGEYLVARDEGPVGASSTLSRSRRRLWSVCARSACCEV